MNLRQLIEQIEGEELKVVSRQIFGRDAFALINYLPRERPDDLEAALFKEVENLPALLIDKVLKYKEEILQQAIDEPKAKMSTAIIRSILRLSADYDSMIQFPFVLRGINNELLPEDIRLSLAIYLAEFHAAGAPLFEALVAKDPLFLPALLSRISLSQPFSALEHLDRNIETADLSYLMPWVEDLLSKLLSMEDYKGQHFRWVRQFLKDCQPLTAEFIEEILSLEPFTEIKSKMDLFMREENLKSIFTPEELDVTQRLIGRVEDEQEIRSYPDVSLSALAFCLVGVLQKKRTRPVNRLAPLFAEYDRRAGSKFHYALGQRKISYDPIQYSVRYEEFECKFPYEDPSRFVKELKQYQKYSGNRTQQLKLLGNYAE